MNWSKSLSLQKAVTLYILLSFAPHLKGQVLVGPVAGGQIGWVNFNNKDNKDLLNVKPFIGFHAGVSVSVRMQKNIFLQTSIMYSQRGKNLEGKYDDLLSNKVKYSYIDMPILFSKEFKVKFGKSRYYNWHIGAGPLVSYWLGGKGVLNSGDLIENGINPPNYNLPYHVTFGKAPEEITQGEMNVENPNKIQLGLTISTGVVFEPIGFNKFMVTTRFEFGHSFYSQDSKGDFGLPGQVYYEDDLQVRNMGLSVSVFYFIDLKLDQRNKGKSTIDINKIKRKK